MATFLILWLSLFAYAQGPPPSIPVIVLDPGHGGKDRGGYNHKGFNLRGIIVPEDPYTYDVVQRIYKIALQKNWILVLTVISPSVSSERESSEQEILSPVEDAVFNLNDKAAVIQGKKGLENRLKVAKKTKADFPKNEMLFISIHFDYEPGKISGAKIYTESSAKSMAFAKMLAKKFEESEINFMVDSSSRTSIDNANKFVVLRDGKITPRALLELGNFNNERDRQLMLDGKGRQKYAEIITQAIEEYLKLLPLDAKKNKKALHK